ncbi:MAG: LytTR family transcriptional regulator [Lentimicrobium sp.]|nr:LytTR family transcriptional regulator [Lentimicrobium sp.]
MNERKSKWFFREYPQNLILEKPLRGAFIMTLFFFGFLIIYNPRATHEAREMGYAGTMAVYSLIAGIGVYFQVWALRKSRYFSDGSEWNLLKELLSIVIILSGLGVIIYSAGFVIEPPDDRWNFVTFLGSLRYTFSVGLLPFVLFSIANYRYLFPLETVPESRQYLSTHEENTGETQIKIESKLKKEELVFHPDELYFAESDGNYVVFNLIREGRIKKVIIRNSISNIEQQLSAYTCFCRTHRAYIVNLNKVIMADGNSLGYTLKLGGDVGEIPVSRQNTRMFDEKLKLLRK